MLPICILAIRDDDDRAYMTRLFVKYQRLMYRTIYDILGDKWATEDVLQTTLLRLIDHLDTLRRLEPEGLAGYIAAAPPGLNRRPEQRPPSLAAAGRRTGGPG